MRETFGDRVRRFRKRCGLTQAELAARIRCARNDIHRIETGQTKNPGIDRVAALAIALNVAIEVLWTGTSSPPE